MLPGTATITYRAWDTAQGVAGSVADVTTSGGDTAFSMDSDLAAVTVKEINDPPVISNVTGPLAYTENDPPKAILPDATVSDPDSPDFADGTLVAAIISGGTPSDRLLIRAQETGSAWPAIR